MQQKRSDYRKPMDKGLHSLALMQRGEDLTSKEKTQLLIALGNDIKDWMPKGGWLSYDAFNEYIQSDCKSYPFSGGFLEQPEWVRDDFKLLRKVLNFHVLNEDLNKRTDNGDALKPKKGN